MSKLLNESNCNSPSCLNTFWLKSCPMIDEIPSMQELPKPYYYQRYSPKVQSAPLDNGNQRRILTYEHGRTNANFRTQWQKAHKGCGPQEFAVNGVPQASVLETWVEDFHLELETCWYNLDQMARSGSLSMVLKELQTAMQTIETTRMDAYDEFFSQFHLHFSEIHFVGQRDAPGGVLQETGNILFNRYGKEQPWRFATDADEAEASTNTDVIYLNPSFTDPNQVMPLTNDMIRRMIMHYATTTKLASSARAGIKIVTDPISREFVKDVCSSDESQTQRMEALIRGVLANSKETLNLNPFANRDQAGFVSFEEHLLPRRYWHDAAGDLPDGSKCLRRIYPFYDVKHADTLKGVQPDINPDYDDPDVAAFQIDVADMGDPFTPYRLTPPDSIGKIKRDGTMKLGTWDWRNIKDNDHNKDGDKGFFRLTDNMQARPSQNFRQSPLILSRRRDDTTYSCGIPNALSAPTIQSDVADDSCEDNKPKIENPNQTDRPTPYGGGCASGQCL